MFGVVTKISKESNELELINEKLDKLMEEINTLKILIDNPESMIKCMTNMYLDMENIYTEAKESIVESNKSVHLIQQDINDIFFLLKRLSNKSIEDFAISETC